MLDHPDLLGNDVQLFADLNADLDQGLAVMGADALRLGQLVPDDLPGQRRVEGLAPALLAHMGHHRGARGFLFLGRRRLRRGGEGLGLVEEEVALLGAARLGLGGEELVQESFELLLDCRNYFTRMACSLHDDH